MMWRASSDHGENDVTGKRRLLGRSKNELDFSSAIRELAAASLNVTLQIICYLAKSADVVCRESLHYAACLKNVHEHTVPTDL